MFLFVKPCIGQDIVIPVKEYQRSVREHRPRLMQGDRSPVEGQHLFILRSPGIRPAVVRIREPAHARFVTVIDRRRSGPGHLHHDGLAHDCRIDSVRGRIIVKMVHPAHLMIGPGQEPRMVMIAQLIHGHLDRRRHHQGHLVLHGIPETVRVPEHSLQVFVRVFFHAREEPGHRLHERVIVHDGIPLVAFEPAFRTSIMLRDDQRVWIRILDPLPELFPEAVVIGTRVAQVRCHIKAPAVSVKGLGNPLARDVQDIFLQQGAALVIQLGQRVMPPPAVIERIIGPLMFICKMEERSVRTVGRHIGAFLISGLIFVDPLPVHPFVEGPAVIEHAVQDHSHAPSVTLLHKSLEDPVGVFQVFHAGHTADISARAGIVLLTPAQHISLVTDKLPQMRIDVIIILYVVLMVGWRDKQGVEIDHIHTQILQIIQFFRNALKISAVKLPDPHGGRPLVPVGHPDRPFPDIAVLVVEHIIVRVSVAEAVDHDLIHHCAFCPVRGMESRAYGKGMAFRKVTRHAAFIIKAVDPSAPDLKIIPEQLPSESDLHRVIVKASRRLLETHLHTKRPADQVDLINVAGSRAEADRDFLTAFGFHRGDILSGLIGKKRLGIKDRTHLHDIFGYAQDMLVFSVAHLLIISTQHTMLYYI